MIKADWAVGAEISFVVLTKLTCGPHGCMSNKPEHLMMVMGAGIALLVVVGRCGPRSTGAVGGGATIANFIFCQEIRMKTTKQQENVAIRQMHAGGERVDWKTSNYTTTHDLLV